MQAVVEQMIISNYCSSITVDEDGNITIWVSEVIPFVVNSTGLYGPGI